MQYTLNKVHSCILIALNVAAGRPAVGFDNLLQLEHRKMLRFWKIYQQMPSVPTKVKKKKKRI